MVMAPVTRVLDPSPVVTLEAWTRSGGGSALEAARAAGGEAVIEALSASGLRGRGGAGFPTGTKWASVAANLSSGVPATIVINGAEGEPGSFKDRAILRSNPYRVLEGGLIAAHTLGAARLVIAIKASFRTEAERLRRAIDEVRSAGWPEGVVLDVLEGPAEYLYGEETALLEVLDGREPFPRIAPPWRRGADDGEDDEVGGAGAAGAELAGPTGGSDIPPALVNNVETMANVPAIVLEGPDWFRSVGTADSPGTVVCTVSGRTRRHGVAEVAMGTPLEEVIESIGGGPVSGRVVAVMSGVSNPLLTIDQIDTPLSYEAMVAAGSGLGAAGFIVFDQSSDLVAVAHGVARFLAVESCGQCTPCKQDGLVLADRLDQLRRTAADPTAVEEITSRLATVTDGARCFLATQQQLVISSVLGSFGDAVAAHADGGAEPSDPELIAAIVDIVDDQAVLDVDHATKQPDWSHDPQDSGESPADRRDQSTP